MTNERFHLFLKEYFNDKVDYFKFKPLILNSNGVLLPASSYLEEDQKEIFISLESNSYEKHIEAALQAHNLTEDHSSYIFNLISWQGTSGAYSFEQVKAKYHSISIKIDKFENGTVKSFSYTKSSDNRWNNGFILLTSECLYRNLEECHKNFHMLKLFVNSLKEKHSKRNSLDTLVKVYTDLEMNEQTFFSWKKKNPKAFQALIDGHFYREIKEIIDCMVTFPDIQKETWNTNEPMRYLDGKEF